MKKSLTLIILSILTISAISCKKNHTCTCKIVTGKAADSVVIYELEKMSDRAAKRECKGKRGAIYGLLYECSL